MLLSEKYYQTLLYRRLMADYGSQYKKCETCGKPTHVMYVCQWGCKEPEDEC